MHSLSNSSEMLDLLPNLRINSQLFVVDEHDRKLYEFYYIGPKSGIIWNQIGYYSFGNEFRSTNGATLFERMSSIARGASRSDEEAKPESSDIPRFLNRQNNQ